MTEPPEIGDVFEWDRVCYRIEIVDDIRDGDLLVLGKSSRGDLCGRYWSAETGTWRGALTLHPAAWAHVGYASHADAVRDWKFGRRSKRR
jgi:hypothetical protein